jgi:hypothetical protein
MRTMAAHVREKRRQWQDIVKRASPVDFDSPAQEKSHPAWLRDIYDRIQDALEPAGGRSLQPRRFRPTWLVCLAQTAFLKLGRRPIPRSPRSPARLPLHARLPAAGSPAGQPGRPARLPAAHRPDSTASRRRPLGPNDKWILGRVGPARRATPHKRAKQGSKACGPVAAEAGGCRAGFRSAAPASGGAASSSQNPFIAFRENSGSASEDDQEGDLAAGRRQRTPARPHRPGMLDVGRNCCRGHPANPPCGGSRQLFPGAWNIDLPPSWRCPQEVTVVSKYFNPTSGEVLMLLSTSDVVPARSYALGDSGRSGRRCRRQHARGQQTESIARKSCDFRPWSAGWRAADPIHASILRRDGLGCRSLQGSDVESWAGGPSRCLVSRPVARWLAHVWLTLLGSVGTPLGGRIGRLMA